MSSMIALKTIEVPSVQDEVFVHLFFAENNEWQDIKYWLWVKELQEKIIKRTSGFVRKCVYHHNIMTNICTSP